MPDETLAGQPTPENTVAAQDKAATTDAQTDGATDENQSPEAEKTFTQKELDEILQKRLAKEKRKARQEVLRELEAQRPPQQQPQADDGRPTRKQGESEDDYADRLADWKADKREEVKKRESLSKRIDDLYSQAEDLDGFDADAYDKLPLSRQMVEAVIDSDVAPVLMKYMADNPDEVKRIAKLPPGRHAAELGKLEAKLENEPQERPKRVSSAPSPINPLRKPSAPSKTYDTTDPRAAKELSTSDWIKAEEARMRRKFAGQT